jgi:uncharacterized lipoprotein YddW (UPF0748 family)
MVHSVDFMSSSDAAVTGPTVRRARWCALVLAIATVTASILGAADRPENIRAITLVAAGGSPAAPRRLVSTALEGGFNTIFVPIPLDAETRAAGAAAIDGLIAEARQRGVRVHGVVNVMLAAPSGELPSSRSHALYRHPEWLMVPRALAIEMLEVDPRSPDYVGRLARWSRANASTAGGLHLTPLLPASVDYIAGEIARVAAAHALDGIHFDGIQFPADDFDYSRAVTDYFRAAMRPTLSAAERARLDEVARIDPFGYAVELPDEWRRFRVARLTALTTRLASTFRAARPGAVISAGIVSGAERALTNHLQDWRTWLDNRFVDALADNTTPGVRLLSSYDALLDGAVTAASH